MTDPTPKWFVVAEELSYEIADPEALIWTISKNPGECGWINDSNQEGYGLSKKDAEELANAANTYAQHKEVIKDLLEAAKYVIENHNFPSTGDDCYKILKSAIQKAQELQPRGE